MTPLCRATVQRALLHNTCNRERLAAVSAEPPLPHAIVEVLLLSARHGCLHYRSLARALPGGAHPDDIARRLSGLTACTPGAVLHSTSWRAQAGGIVLTYAALPDPVPGDDAVPVPVDAMADGGPLTPSPAHISPDAVAAHACRHLALLAGSDRAVGLAAKAQPDLWDLLTKLAPAVAGGLSPVAPIVAPIKESV